MNYREEIQKQWDEAHRTIDMSSLTGTGIGGHLLYLVATDLVTPTSTVLCVGVGTGVWVKEVSQRVKEIWSLDISPLAVEKVIGGFVTNPADLPSNHFDVALSLWVAPHMNDEDLQEQLNHVVRSLKSSGTFAIHYKEPLDPNHVIDNQEGQEGEWRVARAANMLRTREGFAAMVDRAGGKIVGYPNIDPSEPFQIIEVAAHIQPKGE